VTAPALQVIAEKAIALIVGLSTRGPAPRIAAAAPAASANTGLSNRGETALAASPSAVSQDASADNAVIDAFEALRLVNDYRKANGLPPLTLDRRLSAAASALAADMARHDRLSHSGPNGADLEKRLKAAGYPYALAAENVGVGQKSVAELIGEEKTEPSESQNLLLPDAKQMGIAFKYRPDATLKTFWTVVIASRS
jgi:uncharacterized protein YkwD